MGFQRCAQHEDNVCCIVYLKLEKDINLQCVSLWISYCFGGGIFLKFFLILFRGVLWGFFCGPVRPLLNLLLYDRNSMIIVEMTNEIITDYVNSRVEVRTLLVFRCGWGQVESLVDFCFLWLLEFHCLALLFSWNVLFLFLAQLTVVEVEKHERWEACKVFCFSEPIRIQCCYFNYFCILFPACPSFPFILVFDSCFLPLFSCFPMACVWVFGVCINALPVTIAVWPHL